MRKALFFFFIFAFSSCSSNLGYSLVLWNIDEIGLKDGEIVRVTAKSRITKKYVIEINKKKIEVPLWKLSPPSSKRKAKEKAANTAEFQGVYASVDSNGLPIRSEPSNSARQLYRLKKGEIIKITGKTQGEEVKRGDEKLEGEWVSVIASGGTEGWCFSKNLEFFSSSSKKITLNPANTEETADLSFVFEREWYPAYYKDAIEHHSVKVSTLDDSPVLFYNEKENILIINNQKNGVIERVFRGAVEMRFHEFKLINLPIIIQMSSNDEMTLSYLNEEKGKVSIPLVAFNEDLQTLIDEEIKRQTEEADKIVELSSSSQGGILYSSSGEKLSVFPTLAFKMKGAYLFSPVISGLILRKYDKSEEINDYTGVLTFNYNDGRSETNYLYKIEDDSLILRRVDERNIKDSTVISRNEKAKPIIFRRKNG